MPECLIKKFSERRLFNQKKKEKNKKVGVGGATDACHWLALHSCPTLFCALPCRHHTIIMLTNNMLISHTVPAWNNTSYSNSRLCHQHSRGELYLVLNISSASSSLFSKWDFTPELSDTAFDWLTWAADGALPLLCAKHSTIFYLYQAVWF